MTQVKNKKRRGFTIRDDNRSTTPAERQRRLAEHKQSRQERGDRKQGSVEAQLRAKLGHREADALQRALEKVAK